jgi:hypothetical protein
MINGICSYVCDHSYNYPFATICGNGGQMIRRGRSLSEPYGVCWNNGQKMYVANIGVRKYSLIIVKLVNLGLLSGNTMAHRIPDDGDQIEEPNDRAGRSAGSSANIPIGKTPSARRERKRTQEQLDHLAELMGEIGLADVEISKDDIKDLEHIQEVARTQSQLERLKDIEAEIVETQRWNFQASKALLELALK